MSSGKLSNTGTFSITYNLPYRFYKLIAKSSMGELSSQAQIRLSMIEFYFKIKNVSVESNLFKVSRKTFYKWLNRYEESGKRLSSQKNKPKVPKNKRRIALDFKKEVKIKHLREKYIRLGKVKLQLLFKKEYSCFVS